MREIMIMACGHINSARASARHSELVEDWTCYYCDPEAPENRNAWLPETRLGDKWREQCES